MYFEGSGKLCREYVQRRNQNHTELLEAEDKDENVYEGEAMEKLNPSKKLKLDNISKYSKWEDFSANDHEDREEEINLDAASNRPEKENNRRVKEEGSSINLDEKNVENLEKKKSDTQKVNIFESANSNEDLDSILDF